MIYNIIYRRWPVVKSGHWWENNGTVLSEREHVLQVDAAQRTLACHKEELPALLDDDVCCARDEGVAEARVDSCEGLHAAWYDNHSVDAIRAAGDRGRHVVVVVDMVCQCAYVGNRVVRFVFECALRPFTDDEVGLDIEAAQSNEDFNAQDRPGCSCERDDDSFPSRTMRFRAVHVFFGAHFILISTLCSGGRAAVDTLRRLLDVREQPARDTQVAVRVTESRQLSQEWTMHNRVLDLSLSI